MTLLVIGKVDGGKVVPQFENQDADPLTGTKRKQKIAGAYSKRVIRPQAPKCKTCGSPIKVGKKVCRSCISRRTEEEKAFKEAKKLAEEKAKAKKWGRSEASTISIRGVRKNKWKSTYKGPRVRPENYLMEEKTENLDWNRNTSERLIRRFKRLGATVKSLIAQCRWSKVSRNQQTPMAPSLALALYNIWQALITWNQWVLNFARMSYKLTINKCKFWVLIESSPIS